VNGGALRAVIEPQLAAMGLDNRSAQRQSDAEAFGLVGRQRQKCISTSWAGNPGPESTTRTSTKSASKTFASIRTFPRRDFAFS
jgi:hypothetical protein